MMYCTCNERNQWVSNENNLSSSASLHRKSHENCVTQVPPKSALKSTSRSTTTTPKKSVKTIEIRNSPRYSTLPRTRSRGMNTVPNVATISRNEYSSTANNNSNYRQRRQSEQQQASLQCTCKNNCYFCNISYPTFTNQLSASVNPLGYQYPYSTLSLNNQNYPQQQLQQNYYQPSSSSTATTHPPNYQLPHQHHHSMINLNYNQSNSTPSNCTFHTRQLDETIVGPVINNTDSPANSMSASPPPAPPPVPPLNPSCARCRHTSTATLQRQSQVIGSNPHLHASLVHQDESEPHFDFVLHNNYTDLEQASEQFVSLGNLVNKQKVPAKVIKITKTVAVKQPVPVPYPVQVVKFIREQVPVHIPQPSSLPPFSHYQSSEKPQFQSEFSPSSYYNFTGNAAIKSNIQETYVGSKLSEIYGPAQSYSFRSSEPAHGTPPQDYTKSSSTSINYGPLQSASSEYSKPAEPQEHSRPAHNSLQEYVRPAQHIAQQYARPSKEQEFYGPAQTTSQDYPKQAQTSLSKPPSNEGFDTSPFYVKTAEHTIKYIPVPVYIDSEEPSRDLLKSSAPTSYISDNEQKDYASHHSQEPSGKFETFTYSYHPIQNSQSHHSTEAPNLKHYYSPQDSQKSATSHNSNTANTADNYNNQQQDLQDEQHQHYQIKYVYQ
ncbi:unnamed protein product [Diamesa tonsa]